MVKTVVCGSTAALLGVGEAALAFVRRRLG
ncbi:VPDSG-CTERM sorting domain-containing protein [Candidatus Pelagisphaera phototrophica]|nr:VPDSG-CTERM sorting domain-containing protein [Candidatus Pelagisphaera phototrophica]